MRMCSGCQTKIADGIRFCDACKAERKPSSDGTTDAIKSNAAETAEDKRHVGAWPSVLEEYDKRPKKIWSF